MRLRHAFYLAPLLALAGCGSPKGDAPADTLTKGRLRFVAAESAIPLARGERDAFTKMYPQAVVEFRETNTRAAVGDLFGDRADAILIPREPTVEEDSLAAVYKLGLSGWRVGIGSLSVVVHPSNPVRQIALDQLREIFLGQMNSWGRLGGQDGPIRTIWREPNSASYQLIVEKVMAGNLPPAPDAWSYSDSETLERVARDPSAVGILATSSASPKVKVLGVAVARGFPYYLPSLENLWNQKYPLRHYDVLVYRNPGPPLADGIATYMLSNEGQRVARDAGVVPTAVPIKINRAAP